MKIAIFGKTIDPQWYERLHVVLNYFKSRKVDWLCYAPFYAFLTCEMQEDLPLVPTFTLEEGLPPDVTFLLTLGGDGTFLDALPLVFGRDIPVTGINFGRLGFLAGLGPDVYDGALEQLLNGDYHVESRSLIEVSSAALPLDIFPYALNDCVLHRKDAGMLAVTVSLPERVLPRYWADGMIVATPTGSTAYALSVGGPIISPQADVLLLLPIAPHNLNVRPMVLPDDAWLSICVESRCGEAILSLDSRSVDIPSGTELLVKRAPFTLKYIALREHQFIDTLHEKLLWGFDKRNF